MPEAFLTAEDFQYPVMEDFYTIQGEGINGGLPAYFIRLAGCDVGCHWCDVKESWDKEKHPNKSVSELLRLVQNAGAQSVVVTGGEPCMHNLEPLTRVFKNAGLSLWIETSGVHPLTGNFDWICVSPKKFVPARKEVLLQAHELKVVVFHASDIIWAVDQALSVSERCKLLLQPEWGRREQVLPTLIDFVKVNPRWRISLQTHKYMNIP